MSPFWLHESEEDPLLYLKIKDGQGHPELEYVPRDRESIGRE